MSQTVSVVITTYNYEPFIGHAIESVLNQTRRPDEVVVVDDGSTDHTAQVVARYADRGVRYVHKENAGAGAARNRGILETDGEWVAFLDADDRWHPDKLARQLDHARRFPSAGLITGSECQVYDGPHSRVEVRRRPRGAGRVYYDTLVENTVGNPSLVLVRRTAFEEAGLFDETLQMGQDWDMWIRIARLFPVGVVDAVLIDFHRHPQSLTAGRAWNRYVSNRLIHHRYIRQIPDFRVRLRLLLKAQSMNLFYLGAELFDSPVRRPLLVLVALGAILFDPVYRTREKIGLLVRSALGREKFGRLRALLGTKGSEKINVW